MSWHSSSILKSLHSSSNTHNGIELPALLVGGLEGSMAPKYMATEFGELELVSVGGGVAVGGGGGGSCGWGGWGWSGVLPHLWR